MSRVIDGYLMLGWEVEVDEAENYDDEDGLSEDAESRVTEILGRGWVERVWCDPIIKPSLYYDCDYMYVGLVLMNSRNDCLDTDGYARHLLGNSELFERVACDLYQAVMGRAPETKPKLMCVTCEG